MSQKLNFKAGLNYGKASHQRAVNHANMDATIKLVAITKQEQKIIYFIPEGAVEIIIRPFDPNIKAVSQP